MIEIENFVPPTYAEILEGVICRNPEFLWQYNASSNNEKAPQTTRQADAAYQSDQFVHAMFQEGAKRSPFFDVVFPLFYFLEEKTGIRLAEIERIKANLLLKREVGPDAHNVPHIDVPDEGFKSFVYYVMDSDGDTFLFNETYESKKPLTLRKRVSPVRGKAVVFDSKTWHASSNPRQNDRRVVLNFIFSVK